MFTLNLELKFSLGDLLESKTENFPKIEKLFNDEGLTIVEEEWEGEFSSVFLRSPSKTLLLQFLLDCGEFSLEEVSDLFDQIEEY